MYCIFGSGTAPAKGCRFGRHKYDLYVHGVNHFSPSTPVVLTTFLLAHGVNHFSLTTFLLFSFSQAQVKMAVDLGVKYENKNNLFLSCNGEITKADICCEKPWRQS